MARTPLKAQKPSPGHPHHVHHRRAPAPAHRRRRGHERARGAGLGRLLVGGAGGACYGRRRHRHVDTVEGATSHDVSGALTMPAATERELVALLAAGLAPVPVRWGWMAGEGAETPPSLPLVTCTEVSASGCWSTPRCRCTPGTKKI